VIGNLLTRIHIDQHSHWEIHFALREAGPDA
jgi:hypothetical protein